MSLSDPCGLEKWTLAPKKTIQHWICFLKVDHHGGCLWRRQGKTHDVAEWKPADYRAIGIVPAEQKTLKVTK